MLPGGSESDSDCIDDTGCEKLFEQSYWDINYLQAIEIENGNNLEDDLDQNDGNKGIVQTVQRFRYTTLGPSGEATCENYTLQDEDSENGEEESSSDTSLEFCYLLVNI